MSETPQAVLERYIRDGGIITLPHIREAIRAVLDVVRVQYEANEEMTRVLSSAEAERVRAEKFWASAQERADVANVALLDAVKVRGQLRAAEAALRIIAGEAQCADNLMSNVEVARAALAPEGKPKHASYCGDSRGPDPLCGGCGMPWPALEVK